MEYIIDTAKVEDLDALVSFQIDLARDYMGKELDEETLRKGIMGGLLKRDNVLYLVARNPQGEAIGSLMITSEWSDWNNYKYYWIQSAYTRKDMRHKGVFTALVNEVKKVAEKAGSPESAIRLYVERESIGAQIVYEKLGMKETTLAVYNM